MFKLLLVVFFCAVLSLVQSETTKIGIIHYNDVYGQLQRFKKGSSPPVACAVNEAKCVGGVAQLMGHIKDIEENDFQDLEENAKLRFVPGNLISGENGWLPLLDERYGDDGWKQFGGIFNPSWPYYNEMNYYRPNATSLGPRDFDGGLKNLTNFVRSMQELKPIITNLACEVSSSGDEKDFCDVVDRYRIVHISIDFKIGLVGFVNPIVVHDSDPGKLAFTSVSNSLAKVIEEDLSDVNMIIALGTGSLELSKEIIDKIPRVNLVIYGGGKDEDIPEVYPFSYKNKYIVTAEKYAISLGKLLLDIDTNTGEIVSVEGSALVKNDETVPTSTRALDRIKSIQEKVTGTYTLNGEAIIGTTKVKLDTSKESCWTGECLLGDLIADSMIHCTLKNQSIQAAGDTIAVWHSAAFAGRSIDHNSNIKRVDINQWLPYNQMATLVSMNGTVLKKMFETSSTAMNSTFSPQWGQFLHVSSGVEVYYSIKDQIQVTHLRTLQIENGKLILREVEDSNTYQVVIPSSLYNGRNAYYYLPGSFAKGPGNLDKVDISMDYTCVENYVKAMAVLSFGLEQRVFTDMEPEVTTKATTTSTTTTTTTTASTSIGSTPTRTTVLPTNIGSSTPPVTQQTQEPTILKDSNQVKVIVATSGITLLVTFGILALIFAFLVYKRGRDSALHSILKTRKSTYSTESA